MTAYRSIVTGSFLLLAASVLIGCETAVDPLVGEERPFTIWGLLNAGADTQAVRVFPIEDEPGIDRPRVIDATVSTTDLTTGERREWTHRAVRYPGGDVGHVFWAAFRAQNGHRYRLEVTRSDGQASRATVTMPDEIDVTIERTETSPKVFAYVRGRIPNLLGVEMRYEATNLPPLNAWPPDRTIHPPVFFPVEVSYQGEGERIDGGWRFDIDMAEDYEVVRDAYRRNCLITAGAPDIALRRVEFHFIAADSAWNPPGGAFDPDLLVEPGAFSNVENGYGFFGAGEIVAVRWTPTPLVRQHIGYRTERPCPNQPSPVQACMEPPVPCFEEDPGGLWDIYF